MLSFYPDGERGMMPNSFSRTNPIRRYPMNLLEVQSLSKAYGQGETAVHALKNVSFSVPKGEYVAVVGESGSGKSTLLNMVGALDTPTSGKVLIDGKDTFSMKEKQLTVFRRRNIGFIFQSFNLIPELTVEQNIIFPVLLDYRKPDKRYLEELLTVLNLKERRRHLPSQLSGGQQQRVAIGRALITRPALILADEPTGNLDSQNTAEVIRLLKTASKQYEQTILMITHSQSIAQTADRVLQVSDGVLTLGGAGNEELFEPDPDFRQSAAAAEPHDPSVHCHFCVSCNGDFQCGRDVHKNGRADYAGQTRELAYSDHGSLPGSCGRHQPETRCNGNGLVGPYQF